VRRRILIIGGVAAGASAAAKARRIDENAEIVVFERGEYVSFANCGLPYYVARQITDRGKLIVVKPELFRERHRIDVRLKHEVVSIRREEKTIVVRNLETEEFSTEPYDSLVLAPGARPIIPPISGIDAPNVFALRSIPDMDRIDSWLREHSPKHATVIGAGYIGIEMAEALHERGVKVAIVEKFDQILPPVDPDMAALMEDHLKETGLDIYVGDGVRGFEGENRVDTVVLDSHQRISTDMVVMSIGVRPDVTLAEDAGLELGSTGAIAVGATMQTSAPGIWAAGDAVESLHGVTGKPTWIPLAGPANKQGRVAGANAAGATLRMGPSFGTSIVRFNKMTVATSGLNDRLARQQQYDIATALIHANQHAGYYPGAEMLAVKILYERHNGRLLGAQVVGSEGVDKRIDILATALAAHMTIDDLADLDLAYAPPFGSARDPVTVAAFVAQNQISGMVEQVACDELKSLLDDDPDVQLLDVRSREEYEGGHIPGAKLMSVDDLRDSLDDLDRSRPIEVYCQIGLRGYLACRILAQHGFTTRNLSGGLRAWRFDVVTESKVESAHV
jgi:NADPH-dependent 2,4-dienoyl-CoA reductase/sulfur reductase-like enzyme/rhodanese-related sulfurtransferase